MPCTRQTASMFAVFPPATKITSCASVSARSSAGGHGKNARCDTIGEPERQLLDSATVPAGSSVGRFRT